MTDKAQVKSEGIALAKTIAEYQNDVRFKDSTTEFLLAQAKPGLTSMDAQGMQCGEGIPPAPPVSSQSAKNSQEFRILPLLMGGIKAQVLQFSLFFLSTPTFSVICGSFFWLEFRHFMQNNCSSAKTVGIRSPKLPFFLLKPSMADRKYCRFTLIVLGCAVLFILLLLFTLLLLYIPLSPTVLFFGLLQRALLWTPKISPSSPN